MLVLHILSFGFVLGVSTLADKEALLWLRGKKDTLERHTLHQYHILIWTGLLALVSSGIYLMYPTRTYLLGDLLFDAKLLFVVILFINAILIGRLMNLSIAKPFKTLTWNETLSLAMSGAISIFSWLAAALIAYWIFS